MEHVKISVFLTYYEPYIPPRCRRTRYVKKTEEVTFKVRSVTNQEAPVAFRLSDFHHVFRNKTEVRFFKGKLYQWITNNDIVSGGENKPIGIDDILMCRRPSLTYDEAERTREYCVNVYKNWSKDFLIIDGNVWMRVGEPRYYVNTFGLGCNHGGTGLFVGHFYNSNIPNCNYFSALDGDKAVAYANEVARRRGDTNDVGKFEKMIEVLMPECVKIKPRKQHGDGDPFINKLNAICESSSSALEAGLMVMAAL